MNKISIVIPVLNESANIKNLLNYLIENSSEENIQDILVVDGGSIDGTQDMVLDTFAQRENTRTYIRLLTSEKGRAKQMNFGAKNASGNILYFLHADSFPPKNFDKLIIKQVKNSNKAGCFRMKFDSNHWWLKLAGWLTKFSWKIARGGDQSLFITKSLFYKIGGFDESYTIYEDNDFISKLYKRKQFVVIQEWLVTSSRRYKTNGLWKLQYHYCNIHIKRLLGADAQTLNKYYLKHVLVKK
ncbi:glycosyltransferase [Seonamhaeicola sediminis]|uniref:Glycosyltransferase n=1 Tax=Seonamhaeicola sediminis TaxID=2528206 RepID=A0A562YFF0_9FLAO|nr:TIGR04283 family arsenosugar biosynthesis glycosyltransferase [Seonamhaeicola sediminis]TWO33328.1 glycosyltransferase [Seonamhaeicola sediminis]